MRFGLHVPQLGALADPDALVDLAERAEASGWDGFFVWDHVMHTDAPGACDAWVTLGAIAVRTGLMVIGPLVTPLPRRRPWLAAVQATTVDRLSGGRTVFGVGIGTDRHREFTAFAEPATDDRTRAAMLDEGLDIVTALWQGTPVTHRGEHYTLDDVIEIPTPVQEPRIPIWCAAVWPHRPPLRRAARWDGVALAGQAVSPSEAAELRAFVDEHRTATTPFDVALPSSCTTTTALDEYADAGVTWWLHSIEPADELEVSRAAVDAGPPRS
jgi:alkanesulfonate monooxygenase SsuD/methylene tetrahydromethanopterin reductase-like flavin-dependent oxidoreductase (luciferase family)